MNNNQQSNLSVYGEGSAEDFPVLKAFQQYIDAEQAKARRRLLTVSVVFVLVLFVVIGIFSALVISANNRTQVLNDKLLEIALKDKERSLDEAKEAAIQQQSVKALNETLEKLQKRIDEQNRIADGVAAVDSAVDSASQVPVSTIAETEAEKRARDAEARVQKALALLRAEKQKMAEAKQKQREEELERYRREHYPEYYAKKEAEKNRTPTSFEKIEEELDKEVSYFDEQTDDVSSSARPIDEEVSYFEDEEIPAESAEVKPVPTLKNIDLDDDAEPVSYFDDSEENAEDASSSTAADMKPVAKSAAVPDKVDEAIDYFDNLNSLTISGDGKGDTDGWSIPLD